MNKLLLLFIAGSLIITSGCTNDTASYDAVYASDNVYTVGYYNSSPYWGNTYYTGYPGL